MDKKYISTVVLEHDIDDEKKNTIFMDLTKRLTPEGKIPITVDSITIQEAPVSMQPDYYKKLLVLAREYQQAGEQQQYEEPQQTEQQEESLPPATSEEEAEQE